LLITHQTAVTRHRRPESSVIKFIHSFCSLSYNRSTTSSEECDL